MPKTNHIILSSNAGELSPLMDQRFDQEKHRFGCRTLENFIPLIYGSAERRPGLEYIAGQKSNSAKGRVVAFEHSVDDTYILLFENQVIRIFRNGAQILDGVGTEDLSALDNIIAQWLLNEISGVTVVDTATVNHGTATVDCTTLHEDGKVGTGCFNLDGQYTVEIPDTDDFSFTDDSDDDPFSIACWAYVTDKGILQVLLSKWQDEAASEWRLSLTHERKLQLHLADSSSNLLSARVAQWKLNDDAATQVVLDEDASSHDGTTETANTDALTATGKLNACFDFGGADCVILDADSDELSFVTAGADDPFSIAAWIYNDGTGFHQMILSKWDFTTGAEAREWYFSMADRKIILALYDESANAYERKITDSRISIGWHFVVATYDGSGGTVAADGITIYVDGVVVDASSDDEGTYVAMENLATKVIIGALEEADGTYGYYWRDKLDNVILFNTELSQGNVTALWNDGNGTEDLTAATTLISAVSDNALTTGWHFLTCTYSAPTDETAAADGIILYVDGAAVTSTKTNNASYTAMQNSGEEIRIGSQRNSGDTANENFWEDKIDEISVYIDVLTPTEIASLYSTTPYEITTPYLTADLFGLKFEHSADVMFITHPSYEPRRLARTEHAIWTLEVEDIRTGPFRNENDTLTKTITPSATTGDITLTATGHTPFRLGITDGYEPSGSAATSKSQTGALFKLVHASGTPSQAGALDTGTLNNTHTALAVPKGVTWDFVTNGTWGTAGDSASVVLERSYDSGTTYETVVTVTSAANHNIETSGTEDFADAIYRARVSEAGGDASVCSTQLSIRDTSHIGIVEIKSVVSPTSALGTVLKTLGSTNLTHRWSEGSFSNYRGWPIDVTISAEERLTFAGSKSKPLNIWGSFSDDYTDFSGGTNADDAMTHALVGTGQQNRIRWILAKDTLILSTVGGEHLFGASKEDEALTPTNKRARLQTTHGSENIAAIAINQAIIFVQRGGKKIRELLYEFESNSYKADDLTVFANHITESGIVDMAYQRTPDPMLWCVRDDGEIAVMSYERDQKVFAWSRIVTVDSDDDSVFESVAIIYGGAGEEDEVWVTVKRTINSGTVRYVERFKPRDWGSDDEDAFFVDSGVTYDSTETTAMTGATHLVGESVAIYADGAKQDNKTVSATGTFTLDTAASKVQFGLPYTSTFKPMKLNLFNLGLATTKKITGGILSLYKTKRGEWGYSTSTMNPFVFRKAGQTSAEFPVFTGDIPMPFRAGYEKSGDLIIRQTNPLPMTVVALTLEVGVAND